MVIHDRKGWKSMGRSRGQVSKWKGGNRMKGKTTRLGTHVVAVLVFSSAPHISLPRNWITAWPMHEVALAQARISWSRIKHNFKEDDLFFEKLKNLVIYIEHHSFLNLVYFQILFRWNLTNISNAIKFW